MAMTAENFVKEIEGMTVLELNTSSRRSRRSSAFRRRRWRCRWRRRRAPAAAAAPAEEEKTEFTVILRRRATRSRRSRSVREVTSLGLKEAKDLVDGAPGILKEGVSKDEAANIKKKFEEVGAKVEIK